MKRNLSLYIVIIPIFFVLFSIFSLTMYNIDTIRNNGENLILEYKENYQIEQKTKIYNKIHYLTNVLKKRYTQYNKYEYENLKNEVLFLENIVKNIHSRYNKINSDQFLKELIINELAQRNLINSDESFTLIDLNSKKIVASSNEAFLGKNIDEIEDIYNSKIFNLKKDVYENFHILKRKDLNSKSDFVELNFIKYYKPLNLVILYGKKLDTINKNIDEKLLKDINELNFETDNYIFIVKVDEIAGMNLKGKVLLHQANPSFINKTFNDIFTQKIFAEFKDEFVTKLRDYGEGFLTYNFKRPDVDELSQKMTYFYYIKDLKWVIATGFYFYDLDRNVKNYREKIEQQTIHNIEAAVIIALVLTFLTSLILYVISSKINKVINEYAINLKKSSDSVQKQKELFETLFEKSSSGIIVHDKNGKILNCNDMLVKILGYFDKSSIIDKNILTFSPSKQFDNELSVEKFRETLNYAVAKGIYNFDWQFITKSRKKIYCDVNSTKIELDGKEVIHTTLRDITDSKELEEQTKVQQLMLAEESKKAAMGEMITLIAHQWRQPLNNVNLLIYFVRDNLESERITKKELVEIANDMKDQIEYLSKTIDDFTNFINPRKVLHQFKLEETIDKTLNLLKGPIEKRKINVFKEIEDITIDGIENEFMQVLLNILNNAKDSLNDIKDERYIFINGKKRDNKLYLTIKDNAGGIDEKILRRIFEPYFTTKHKSNGTGIGLYMSEVIIRQYKKGKIVASNESYYYNDKFYKGAMFTISFELN